MTEPDYSNVLDVIRKKILTCTLCTKRFGLKDQANLPICLDCSHTFCFACLTRVRLGMGIFSTIACPCCGVETTAGVSGVSGLNRNEITVSLINIIDSHEVLTDACRSPSANFAQTALSPSISSHSSSSSHSSPGQTQVHRQAQEQQSDVVENVVRVGDQCVSGAIACTFYPRHTVDMYIL